MTVVSAVPPGQSPPDWIRARRPSRARRHILTIRRKSSQSRRKDAFPMGKRPHRWVRNRRVLRAGDLDGQCPSRMLRPRGPKRPQRETHRAAHAPTCTTHVEPSGEGSIEIEIPSRSMCVTTNYRPRHSPSCSKAETGGKIRAMIQRAATLLAILAAVGVTLPPTVFCPMSGSAEAANAPRKKACCSHCRHHRSQERTNRVPGPTGMPGCPVCQFCAQRPLLTPVKRVQSPDSPVSTPCVATCEVSPAIVAPVRRRVESPYPEKPPTHLLHCVWLC